MSTRRVEQNNRSELDALWRFGQILRVLMCIVANAERSSRRPDDLWRPVRQDQAATLAWADRLHWLSQAADWSSGCHHGRDYRRCLRRLGGKNHLSCETMRPNQRLGDNRKTLERQDKTKGSELTQQDDENHPRSLVCVYLRLEWSLTRHDLSHNRLLFAHLLFSSLV